MRDSLPCLFETFDQLSLLSEASLTSLKTLIVTPALKCESLLFLSLAFTIL